MVKSGGEQGLLSLAFHPGYAKNHRFFVYFNDTNGDVRVYEYRSSGGVGVPGSGRSLLLVPHRSSTTTTAASCSSARTGSCTPAPATAARAATRTTTRRTSAPASGSSCA